MDGEPLFGAIAVREKLYVNSAILRNRLEEFGKFIRLAAEKTECNNWAGRKFGYGGAGVEDIGGIQVSRFDRGFDQHLSAVMLSARILELGPHHITELRGKNYRFVVNDVDVVIM